MTREWKLGAIARTARGGTVARTALHRWVLLDDGHRIDLDHEPRPLAVIDPEDREQVERLVGLRMPTYNTQSVDGMQAALREFADPKPPKPKEPTGLGAVVEDDAGQLWVQFSSKNGMWWRCHIGRNARWSDINAVRVLSEGVVPSPAVQGNPDSHEWLGMDR